MKKTVYSIRATALATYRYKINVYLLPLWCVLVEQRQWCSLGCYGNRYSRWTVG